ncbi:MAG: DUF2812 domain-containing protein [Lachnospiraceae bacterium]|nr:DUF2812 domain-containing protein [Lachnospiraceae bacterium]
MGTEYKRVRKQFDYMHCDDFAAYLSEMAAKGWHFKLWEDTLVFEKGEPADVTYAVEVFTKAKEGDFGPEQDTFEFSEYCESAGWKFVDSQRKFCILKKIKENAVPLFTPEERVKNAYKASVSGGAVWSLVLYSLIALVQCFFMIPAWQSFLFPFDLFFIWGLWMVLLGAELWKFVYAVVKKAQYTKRSRQGETLYIGNQKQWIGYIRVKWITAMFLVAAFLESLILADKIGYAVFYALVIVGALFFATKIVRAHPDRTQGKIYWVIFSVLLVTVLVLGSKALGTEKRTSEEIQQIKQELPLRYSDYKPYEEKLWTADINCLKNVLGEFTEYVALYDTRILRYQTYCSEYEWLIDGMWDIAKAGMAKGVPTDCAAEWEAQEAYLDSDGDYYVKYENVYFVLYEWEELTKNQIDIIRDKMGLR